MGNATQPQTTETDLIWGWPVLVISTWIALIGISTIIMYSLYQFYILHKYHNSLPLNLQLSSMAAFVMSWIYVTYQYLTWSEWFTGHSDCKWILDVLIILLSLTKCTYYWFLTVRLQVSFDGSVYAVKPSHLWILRIGSILGIIILAILTVYEMKSPDQYSHKFWGLYCGQLIPIQYALIYGAYDAFICGMCVYFFVSRLSKVARSVIDFDEMIKDKTGRPANYHSYNNSRTSTFKSEFSSTSVETNKSSILPPPIIDENDIKNDISMHTSMPSDNEIIIDKKNNKKRILSSKSLKKHLSFKEEDTEQQKRVRELRRVKREWKKNNKLYKLGKVHTILTLISIISTQIIFGIGFTLWSPAVFISQLDTLINCICFLCMFRFIHLMKRINIAGPFCWFWCCWPFSSVCYTRKKRERLSQIVYKYKISMGMMDREEEIKYRNKKRKFYDGRGRNEDSVIAMSISPSTSNLFHDNMSPVNDFIRVTSATALSSSQMSSIQGGITDLHEHESVVESIDKPIYENIIEDLTSNGERTDAIAEDVHVDSVETLDFKQMKV